MMSTKKRKYKVYLQNDEDIPRSTKKARQHKMHVHNKGNYKKFTEGSNVFSQGSTRHLKEVETSETCANNTEKLVERSAEEGRPRKAYLQTFQREFGDEGSFTHSSLKERPYEENSSQVSDSEDQESHTLSLTDRLLEKQDDQLNKSLSQSDPEDELLYPGAPLTKGQSLLLLMSYVLRHNLTGTALEHLLKIFNEHFPGLVPETLYLFNKAYGEYGHYQPHFYCSLCSNYMGERENCLTRCIVCQTSFDADCSLKNGNYFLMMSLAAQIKDILECAYLPLTRQKTAIEGVLNDIQSGMEYRMLRETRQMKENDVSLLWNCDGIPIFKSSKYQIWPIQCQVIELLPKDRQSNICVPCIWFGEKKPNMTTLLTPFVNELLSLETDGITWTDQQNQIRNTKVYALICSSDLVARPLLRNTKQFNGAHGCDFCYHRGGGPYPYRRPEPLLRNESKHYEHAMTATPEQPVMGVKGPSVLMRLSKFQMINGFVPEYQHSVCLGVTRQLCSLWLNSTNHDKEWYIGTKATMIDHELLAVQPPVEVTRTPRSVQDRRFWKASEWRSFLLYYSLPVLNGVLLKKYWNHLFLLVFAIHMLISDSVNMCDVNVAEVALKKFVIQFEVLYGVQNVSFNVHLLTHIAASVKNWGPLWATSTFSFESFNGTLKRYFNGTTHVPVQIVKRFLKWKSLSKKAEKCMKNANDEIRSLFSELQNSNKLNEKSEHLSGNVRIFGAPSTDSVPESYICAIKELIGIRQVDKCSTYSRFLVHDTLYHAECGTRLQKRNNSVVELQDGMLCQVLSLVAFEPASENHTWKRQCCVVVRKLVKSGKQLCRDVQLNITSKFLYEVSQSNDIFAIHADSLKRKCVMVKAKEKLFVIPLPNNKERD